MITLTNSLRWVPAYDLNTALIVVDCQNDFADPAGSLYVKEGEVAISFSNEEIRAATAGGALVVYTQDWHPESTPHFAKDGGIWPIHCVAGTWGAEFHPLLDSGGVTIRKGSNGEDGYSGFTMRDPVSGEETSTELESILRQASVHRVYVVGLALDYCVKATALDARRLGFETTVLIDATRAVDLQPGDGERAMGELLASEVGVM